MEMQLLILTAISGSLAHKLPDNDSMEINLIQENAP